MSIVFSFPSPVPLSDLHSFPTRRSSDLPSFCRTASGRQGALRHAATKCPFLRGIVRGASQKWALRRRDRKSTRLNSSHVEISYAVFCLKKKKKSQIENTSTTNTTKTHTP